MKNDIINILKNSNKALSREELYNELDIVSVEGVENLNKELDELVEDYTLYHTNKDRFMIFEDSHLVKGKLSTNRKGYGFVEGGNTTSKEDDIFISADNMNGAIDGDLVICEITSKKNIYKKEGRILKIIDRNLDGIVGEYQVKDGKGIVIPDNKKLKINLIIPKEEAHNVVPGHKVLAKIKKETNNNIFYGTIEKILGHKNDPGVDILSVVYKYKINDEFPQEVMDSLNDIPDEVREEDFKGRTDLRNEQIFTIDGDDTRDIDDAISIKKLNNGNYLLGVHIADLGYYIEEGSPLDNEAMARGTSVYLVDRVIPMYPHKLCNGICSLNPDVDRLTISCVMEIDEKGKVVDHSLFPSVIHSRKQMTYKCVNKLLEEGVVEEGYEPFEKDLLLMNELSVILRKKMISKGYINFDVDEAKILVDENCVPIEIKRREQRTGEQLIENFMVIANETVAEHIFYMNLPFIYRVHEYPREERIRDFLSFVNTLGYHYNGNLKDLNPRVVQGLLEYLSDKKESKILNNLLLRCMQKAVYSSENIGHYGLASKCYTHFTSPIRRYPDTTVSRLLHTYLFNSSFNNDTIRHWDEKLSYVADLSSSKEQAAQNCEREVEDMKMAEYMESHIGEEFEGMINSVLSFGMFVELDNLVEGLVPIKDMDDFYHYNEDTLTLTGQKSHKEYRIGDRVRVKVVRASKEERQIDFELVEKL